LSYIRLSRISNQISGGNIANDSGNSANPPVSSMHPAFDESNLAHSGPTANSAPATIIDSKIETEGGHGIVSSVGELGFREHNVTKFGSVVDFVDNTDDMQEDAPSVQLTKMQLGSINDDILQYLKRPVKIYEFTWDVTGATFAFDPWALLMTDKAVSRKIANFYLVKFGGLNMRMVSNGTPYQYGRYQVAYWPELVNDPFYTTTSSQSVTKLSSLPCYHTVDPGANTVVEFHLPEVRRRAGIITSTTFITNGQMVGYCPVPIASATSGGLAAYCDLTFFASCGDPQIYWNTTAPPAYATSSEWKGKFSKPLFTVAKRANELSSLPGIGAMATSVGQAAKLGGKLAEMFGYSKPLGTENIPVFNTRQMGTIANSVGMDSSVNMSLNPQAQTIVDPKVYGIDQDEMVIHNIASRYSVATSFTFADTNNIGDVLYNTVHTPLVGSGTYPYTPTNLAYMCYPFLAWRGSIIYKFEFCVSKFHTGRVQISYDPFGALTSGIDPSNTTINAIVDLNQQSTVEFEVPYMYSFDWATMNNVGNSASAPWGSTSLMNSSSFGQITITLLNKLRCGNVATTVYCLVSLKAGPDFELSTPSMISSRSATQIISFFPSASTGASPTNVGYEYYGTSKEVSDSETFAIDHYSERILSIRELGKRYLNVGYYPGNYDFDTGKIGYVCFRDMPNQPGYAYNGTVNQLGLGLNTVNFNSLAMNYFNYFAGAFVGWKGSIRSKFVPDNANFTDFSGTSLLYPLYLARISNRACSNYMSGFSTSVTSHAGFPTIYNFSSGGEIIPVTQSGKPFEINSPWQCALNYELNGLFCTDYGIANGLMIISMFNMPPMQIFKAYGDDFSWVFYKGPPTFYAVSIG